MAKKVTTSPSPIDPASATFSSVALCCLLAIAVVVALGQVHDSLPKSIVLWLLFVTVCGCIIDKGSVRPWYRTYIMSIAPSIVFLLAAIFVTIVSDVFYGLNYCLSCAEGPPTRSHTALFSLYLIVSLLTTIAISTSCVASYSVMSYLYKLNSLPVQSLSAFRAKIVLLISIAGIIISAIVVRL